MFPAILSAVQPSILDSDTLTFIISGAKEVLGIMTTPPLGVFITISVISAVAGLVAGIVHMVKGRK